MTRHCISNHLIAFQILSSGFCSSIVHILKSKKIIASPVILGHGGDGVNSTGESVTNVKLGGQLGKIQCQPSKFSFPNSLPDISLKPPSREPNSSHID